MLRPILFCPVLGSGIWLSAWQRRLAHARADANLTANALLAVTLLAGALAASSVPAAAEGSKGLRRFGAKIEISEPQTGTVIAGGARVSITAPVDGDLWLAGADVAVDGPGVGGVMAAGAELKIGAKVGSSLTLLGSRVFVRASVKGDISAVASRIEIAPEVSVGGQVKLYGAAVDFQGQASERVSIEGDEVTFGGAAKGNVRIEGLKVRIADTARIEGALDIYTIGEPEIAPGAKIAGKVTRHSLRDSESMRAYLRGLPLGILAPAMLAVSALIAGLFLLWLGRGGVERIVDELIDSPGSSGLWGLATLVILPVVAALLALTVFGLPVAALALMALPLLLLLGFASSGFGVGEWLFNRLGEPRSTGQRTLQLLGGLVVLVLLGILPYAGPWLLVLAGITGLGGLLRSLHDGMRGRPVM